MGDTFIRNFYTSFDYEKENVYLAKNSNAAAGVSIDHRMNPWAITGIVLGVLLFLIITYCCVKRCIRKRKEKKTQAAMEKFSGS